MDAAARASTRELRAVAALVRISGPALEVIGPCALVTNGTRTVALASAELLRRAPEPLAIALRFDATATVPVVAWTVSRNPAMGLIDLGAELPQGALDVTALPLASVNASVDTRGAPAVLVSVVRASTGWSHRLIPVHVDSIETAPEDALLHVASPDDLADVDASIDGAVLLARLPPDPVLGRPAEVLMTALATPWRSRAQKPRALAPIAELSGLEDLARALPWKGSHDASGLGLVAGEIERE